MPHFPRAGTEIFFKLSSEKLGVILTLGWYWHEGPVIKSFYDSLIVSRICRDGAQWLNSWGLDCESTLRYIDYHTILQQILCSSVYHANPFSVTPTLPASSDLLSITSNWTRLWNLYQTGA